MLKKAIALLLISHVTYSYANNCPQYAEIYNGASWLESFNGWVMKSSFKKPITGEGFKRVMVFNNNTIVCEYQNSIETKNYMQINTFQEILGSNWLTLPGGSALLCKEQSPLSCLFNTNTE